MAGSSKSEGRERVAKMAAGDSPRLSGTNLVRAADHNQRVTLHAIRVGHALTRVDLARITGLTAPAIANITRRLLQDGLIEEAGQRRGGRGQPPTKLVVRRDACFAIGVNIDRDHVTIVVVDFTGQTLASVTEDTAFALPEDVRTIYRRAVKPLLRRAKVDPTRLIGIGVAMPDDLGRVELPGRPSGYAAWNDTDPRTLFSQPYDLPVFVENDAAAAAMGEMQLGHGQQFSSFFYILMSAGLGGGFVVDGNYVRGADGRSGELGFMPVVGAAPRARQVQQIVSLTGLAAALEKDGFALADALHATPAAAGSIDSWLAEATATLRAPLDAINCLINPAAVLIGGRLPDAIIDNLAARLTKLAAEDRCAPTIAPVLRARLSRDAPAVGAAVLPLSHFLLPHSGALWKNAMAESN